MSKTKMSAEILNVIHAVLDLKRFVNSHNYIFPKEMKDPYEEAEIYYMNLPLPEGLRHNKIDFERILSYGKDNIRLAYFDSLEETELNKEYF